MIRKPLAEICETDLAALVDNEVAEGRTIEYKRDLPTDSREAKSEFMNDVLSFANSSGGDLIFGIEEAAGVPTAILGVDVSNSDHLGLRLENICRDNIEPRIPPLQLRVIPLASGCSAVVVRIAQSWQAPHRNRQSGAFSARNSRGKYPMDVAELRAAFLNSANLEARVRQFRDERSKIISNELAPRPLRDGIAIGLHVVPLESMLGERLLNLNGRSDLLNNYRPMGHISGFSVSVNLDGAVSYDGAGIGYTQLFRAGQVEALYVYPDHPPNAKALYGDFETQVRTAAPAYLAQLRELDYVGPVAMMLSIYRAKGSYLHIDAMSPHGARQMHLDTVHTPDVLVNEAAEVDDRLTELFEIIWNGYGRLRPKNYVPKD